MSSIVLQGHMPLLKSLLQIVASFSRSTPCPRWDSLRVSQVQASTFIHKRRFHKHRPGFPGLGCRNRRSCRSGCLLLCRIPDKKCSGNFSQLPDWESLRGTAWVVNIKMGKTVSREDCKGLHSHSQRGKTTVHDQPTGTKHQRTCAVTLQPHRAQPQHLPWVSQIADIQWY